jgi:hypothetical protein
MSSTERVRAFDEAALTECMHNHLKVVIGPLGDRDELGRLDTRVLEVLDRRSISRAWVRRRYARSARHYAGW